MTSSLFDQSHFLVINEYGDVFFDVDKAPISDPNQLQEIFNNLKLKEDYSLVTEFQDELYLVESFDQPLQITYVELKEGQIYLQTKHNLLFMADEKKWSVDQWDRFNGLTTNQAPFVLTEKAQNQLFNQVDSFDDEGFSFQNKYVSTSPYFFNTPDIEKANYWSQIYISEQNPGWNLNQPAEAFKDMLPRLKLPKSRILVLGSGEGHDAALFAEAGHVVTAVDFSKEAIQRGQKKYAHLDNLHFYHGNIFDLPSDWNHSFDFVIEHTCFCAIPTEQRDDLVKMWRRLLHEEGQLIATFFAMSKRPGPPYGSTEWEIRKRLKDHFQFLFWGRWRKSLPQRQGRELFVLAKKK